MSARRVIIVNSALTNFGFFVITPYLMLHFTHALGLGAAVVGTVLALRQFSQQAGNLLSGAWADRVGYRRSMLIGYSVRGVGFAAMGFAPSLPVLLAMALMAGAGGALFDAPGRAALTRLSRGDEVLRSFALSAALANVGAMLGPLAGLVILDAAGWPAVALTAGGMFIATGVYTARAMPRHVLAAPAHAPPTRLPLREITGNRPFLLLSSLLVGYWFLATQPNVTLPLYVARLAGSLTPVGTLLAINSGLAIAVQYPLLRWLELRRAMGVALGPALGAIALGFAVMALSGSFPGWVVAICLYSLGNMIMSPAINALTAQLAPASKLGSYFGFASLAVALGGGLGSVLGGGLYDAAVARHAPGQVWLVFAALAVAVGVGISALRREGLEERG